ncbi:MAG: DUF1013 domain-containing protein [Beijerinckiaceae bacterium]
MSTAPLMPKATAVWLVDNTSLTFDQIAEFCNLHPLEVKGIADGEVAAGIRGHDPITSGQLTRDEIAKAEADEDYRLQLAKSRVRVPEIKKVRGPRYTPLSRRQDRPNAILWLVRNHPELKDAQVMRLVGTTKATLQAVRERTHWNSSNLQPLDPVTLGLCSQLDLDFEVARANKNRPQAPDEGATLVSAEITTGPDQEEAYSMGSETPRHEDVFRKSETPAASPDEDEEASVDVNSVFAKLKELKQHDE